MDRLFAADGRLARRIPGYAPRPVQQRMAQAVGEAIADGASLVVEAGTGTGKTFAYLVPALLSGRRVVVSTGTLNLQDQLFHRDLPRVREALGVPARICLLKGRANYLCRYRLQKARSHPALRGEWARLRELSEWAQGTDSGEVAESGVLADDDPLTPRVTSTAENCLGSRCPDFEQCFVVKARRAAQAADLVVVNHHLLLADFALKEEGFGQILPGADAIVVDEAHQLPETATRFFGQRVSTRQLSELAQDSAQEAADYGDLPDLAQAARALAAALPALEARFVAAGARETLEAFLARAGVAPDVHAVAQAVDGLAQVLRAFAERGPGLVACADRAQDRHNVLSGLLGPASEAVVRWVEAGGRGGSLCATPVHLAENFTALRAAHPGAWVFTSATLAVGEDFGHFCRELGLSDARTLRLESPFDYASQARLYLPPGLPDPNDPAYTDAVVDAALPVLEASRGGAFLLCTSHRALRRAAERLRREQPFPLFVQGEASRTQLLERFAAAGNGVLVGTQSFWEGVDVRGQALRVVMIDKLPFAAPGDPVFDARLRAIRQAGGDPFRDYQLPQAIMTLRQGIGRLIRDVRDRGLLVLCDPRLRSRPYGRKILSSLPPMATLDDLAGARAWLHSLETA
ncbi:MAG: ATP-dependent DNA helicase [Gammaproteobacteria bacterium]|nr:ATP-dependent DNA helicase [Gammaproteobacteria bacterium]